MKLAIALSNRLLMGSMNHTNLDTVVQECKHLNIRKNKTLYINYSPSMEDLYSMELLPSQWNEDPYDITTSHVCVHNSVC